MQCISSALAIQKRQILQKLTICYKAFSWFQFYYKIKNDNKNKLVYRNTKRYKYLWFTSRFEYKNTTTVFYKNSYTTQNWLKKEKLSLWIQDLPTIIAYYVEFTYLYKYYSYKQEMWHKFGYDIIAYNMRIL